MIGFLLQGIGYGFAGAAQPGPFQTYIISKTLLGGWRPTLVAALAPLISDGPIILLVLVLLNQMPPAMLRLLHLASGLFLGLLATAAFRRWRRPGPVGADAAGERRGNLTGAVVMNFLSPGPYLFWSLVAGPTLLAGWRQAPLHGVAFLLGFYVTLVGTYAGTILLFGSARRLGERVTHAMIGLSAVTLAAFGLFQLWLGISG